MKRALDFATKLNSRDIQKCHWFWVPSYDLLAPARKTEFPAPTAIGVHRLRNTWSSPWEVICYNVDVIPPEGKKKKAGETTYNGHATEKVQQKIPSSVKCVVVFICLPFIFSVPPWTNLNNKQWFTLLKLRGQTGWGEDSSFIKVQREWLLSIAISR